MPFIMWGELRSVRLSFLTALCFHFFGVEFITNAQKSDIHCNEGIGGVQSCSPRILVEDDNADDGGNSNNDRCSLYMAESSIPNAGYGVYTTRDIQPNEAISSFDAPSICVTDVYYHYGRDPDWSSINYYWSGIGYTSFESEETSEMVANVGTLANYHMFLENMDHWSGSYDDDMLDRMKDPGAGAFSYYSGHHFVANKFIQAGDEIFADYGDEWLETRDEAFRDIPRKDDYVKAGKILTRFFDGWINGMQDMEYDIAEMLKDILSVVDARMASLLPKSLDEMKSFYQSLESDENRRRGRVSPTELMYEKLAYGTTHRKNITWIEENGFCIDNILPKQSTLEQAGRGAFARRKISKGSMIVPVPLLQLMDKEAVNMYEMKRDKSTMEMKKVGDEVIGKQLLLNYCFGHGESSMLLCPTTNAVLMNHCSDRRDWGGSCGQNQSPNAVVRWASWDKKTELWLDLTLEKLTEKTRNDERGLTLEIIALRDIQPGEEVFIDYGIEWEEAYVEHVKKWQPPKEGSGFELHTSVKKMNGMHGDAPFRTLKEQDDEPYPDNIMTVCYKLYEPYEQTTEGEPFPLKDEMEEEEAQMHGAQYFGFRNFDRLDIEEVDPTASNQFVTNGRHQLVKQKSDAFGWFIPCQVLGRNVNDFEELYTVRLLHNTGDEDDWVRRNQARLLINYPKSSIKFATKSYKSDQFLPGAFRHHIVLGEDMFPKRWKDLIHEEVFYAQNRFNNKGE